MPLEPEKQTLQELEAALTLHPDDAPRRSQALEAHLAGETPHYEIEYRVRRPDGNFYWIHIRALCIRDAAGKPLRIAGSVADIDARKRAEMALRESEERFAAAVAGSDDGLWMFDYVTGQGFASTRAQQIVGLEPGPELLPLEEILAGMSRQLHPEDLPRRNQLLAQHLAGGTPAYVGEFRVRHPDGKYRWVRTHGRCVRDAEGKLLRMAGSTSDVDARKRAEEELRQSEERYALAMAGSRGGHWVWDTATDALFVSDKVNELFGVEADAGCRHAQAHSSPRSSSIPRIASGSRRSRPICYRDASSAATTKSASSCPRASAGSSRALSVSRHGQSQGIAGVSVDIGERKRAESRAPALEEQLRQAQKLEAMGTLAGGIAHDFNNILAAILGYGEMALRDAPEGTPLRRDLDSIMAAGERATCAGRPHPRLQPQRRRRARAGPRAIGRGRGARRGCGEAAAAACTLARTLARRRRRRCSATRRRCTRW